VLTFKSYIGQGGVRLSFSDKPPEAIRSILKANGFRWQPPLAPAVPGYWWRRGTAGAADFLTALERRVNPAKPDGACWSCQAPNGFFRPQGAAAPVLCDACHAKRQDRPDPMGVDGAFEDRCRDTCGL